MKRFWLSSHLDGFHCLFMRLASMLLYNEHDLHGEPALLHDAYMWPAPLISLT